MSERRKIAYALLNGFAIGLVVSTLVFNWHPERFHSVKKLINRAQIEGACFAYRKMTEGIPDKARQVEDVCRVVAGKGAAK